MGGAGRRAAEHTAPYIHTYIKPYRKFPAFLLIEVKMVKWANILQMKFVIPRVSFGHQEMKMTALTVLFFLSTYQPIHTKIYASRIRFSPRTLTLPWAPGGPS